MGMAEYLSLGLGLTVVVGLWCICGYGLSVGLWWPHVCVVEGAMLHGFVWWTDGGCELLWILCGGGGSVDLSGFLLLIVAC